MKCLLSFSMIHPRTQFKGDPRTMTKTEDKRQSTPSQTPRKPECVYTYLKAQHALDNICAQQLKLTEVGKTNDPFEYWFEMVFDGNISLEEGKRMAEKWFSEFSVQNAEKMFFVPFSDSCINLPMWAYYGDRHEGVCLGFPPHDEFDGEESLRPVAYPKKRLACDRSERQQPNDDENMKFVQSMFWTKRREWSIEKEWRMCVPANHPNIVTDSSGGRFFRFSREALKEVVFGYLCSDEDIGRILLACFARGLSPRFFRQTITFKSKHVRRQSTNGVHTTKLLPGLI